MQVFACHDTHMTIQEARILLGETGKRLTDEEIKQDLLCLGELADALLDNVLSTNDPTKSVINHVKADGK